MDSIHLTANIIL